MTLTRLQITDNRYQIPDKISGVCRLSSFICLLSRKHRALRQAVLSFFVVLNINAVGLLISAIVQIAQLRLDNVAVGRGRKIAEIALIIARALQHQRRVSFFVRARVANKIIPTRQNIRRKPRRRFHRRQSDRDRDGNRAAIHLATARGWFPKPLPLNIPIRARVIATAGLVRIRERIRFQRVADFIERLADDRVRDDRDAAGKLNRINLRRRGRLGNDNRVRIIRARRCRCAGR